MAFRLQEKLTFFSRTYLEKPSPIWDVNFQQTPKKKKHQQLQCVWKTPYLENTSKLCIPKDPFVCPKNPGFPL